MSKQEESSVAGLGTGYGKEIVSPIPVQAVSGDSNYAALPLPPLPKTQSLLEADPELYAAWRNEWKSYSAVQFGSIHKRSEQVFATYMSAYRTVIWMYRITFMVGVVSFSMAVISSFYFQQWMFPVLFGGMTVFSFATIFFFRPPEALEQGLEFPTWLDIAQKFSVLRTMYLADSATITADLKTVMDDTVQQINQIIDKRQELQNKRKGLSR